MTHNPIECAKCGRGHHVKDAQSSAWFGYWVCCKTEQQGHAIHRDDKPDLELSAARSDKRQMDLPL